MTEKEQREVLAVEALSEKLQELARENQRLLQEINDVRNERREAQKARIHPGLSIGSNDLERAVLACVILDSDSCYRYCVGEGVSEESFLDKRNRVLWNEISAIMDNGGPVDELILSDHLRKVQKIKDAGGDAHILDITSTIDTATHLPYYVERLQDAKTLRDLSMACVETLDGVTSGAGDINDLLTDRIHAFQRIASDRVRSREMVKVSETVKEAFERIKQQMENPAAIMGVSTGLRGLDDRLTGLHPGKLYVIAARPGMGKSSLGLLMAESAALSGYGSLFFTLEMSRAELEDRLIKGMARVSKRDLLMGAKPQHRERLNHVYKTIKAGLDLTIIDKPSITIEDVYAKVDRWKKNRPSPVVVIDYLQIMGVSAATKNANREQQIGHISRSAKALAKSHQVAVVMLAQLNRECDKEGRLPRVSDLRESGAIEQDADVIALISLRKEDIKDSGYIDEHIPRPLRLINVVKQRDGAIGGELAIFDKGITRFTEQ